MPKLKQKEIAEIASEMEVRCFQFSVRTTLSTKIYNDHLIRQESELGLNQQFNEHFLIDDGKNNVFPTRTHLPTGEELVGQIMDEALDQFDFGDPKKSYDQVYSEIISEYKSDPLRKQILENYYRRKPSNSVIAASFR